MKSINKNRLSFDKPSYIGYDPVNGLDWAYIEANFPKTFKDFKNHFCFQRTEFQEKLFNSGGPSVLMTEDVGEKDNLNFFYYRKLFDYFDCKHGVFVQISFVTRDLLVVRIFEILANTTLINLSIWGADRPEAEYIGFIEAFNYVEQSLANIESWETLKRGTTYDD